VLISDRDPRFTAAFYRQLATRVGTDLRFTTAFHAQANGLAERNVAIAKSALIPYTNHDQDNWAVNLPILQLTLNNRAKRAKDGLAPNEIVMGMLPSQFPGDAAQLRSDSVSSSADDLAERRAIWQLRARDAVMDAQDAHSRSFNAGRSGSSVQVGDLVMVDTNALKLPEEADRSCRALAFRRDGPFKVLRVLPGGRLELELPLGHRAHSIVAMEHCSIFKGVEPKKAQPEISDPSLFVITDILASRLPRGMKSSNPKARLEKRAWLTKFSENKQDSVWLKWKDFVDDDNVAQQLVDFEQARTGLIGTLDASWEYSPDKPGEVSLRSDGFRTYTTVKGDTPEWIAKELGVPVLDLLEQNVMRLAVGVPLQGKSKLKVNSVFRHPKRISVPKTSGKRHSSSTTGRSMRQSSNKSSRAQVV
jgi:LysM repeat protein